MKIPKEIRNKSHQPDRKKQISNLFRKTFLELNKMHEPRYSVAFRKIGEKGKYSDQVYNWLGGYNNLDSVEFILMVKEYNDIELYLNWERLGLIKYNGIPFYQLSTHLEFFKKLYEQCAYHEYGHTYLMLSTSMMFYPTEVLDYLGKNEIRYISELPLNKRIECNQINEHSDQALRDQKLNNFKFMDVANGVGECHANYCVLTKLRKETPTELLKFSRADLLSGLHDYSNFDINSMEKSYLNRRIINWIVKSSDFLVYDKWHIIEKETKKYGFERLSKLAYDISSKFLKIAKNDDDLVEMKKEMLTMAEEIDKLNFIEIVFTK